MIRFYGGDGAPGRGEKGGEKACWADLQGLPFDKAVPACLQAGAGRWQQERDIYFINVSILSLVRDTPVLLKVIGKNCRAQQRRPGYANAVGFVTRRWPTCRWTKNNGASLSLIHI